MSGEKQPFGLSDHDKDWLANLLSDFESSSPRPIEEPTLPHRDGITLSENSIIKFNSKQNELIKLFQTIGLDSSEYEHVEIDLSDILKNRMYCDNIDFLPKGLRFAEFVHIKTLEGIALGRNVGIQTDSQLTIGKHTDLLTEDEMELHQELNRAVPFREETIYLIGNDNNQKPAIKKVTAIPYKFQDPRTDLLPQNPYAQYVESELRGVDIPLIEETLNFFLSELHK